MNPFKEESTQFIDFETMSDLKWHCSKCELLSGQAKTWQVWRQEKGIQLDTDENGNWFKRIYCPNCRKITIHRKLKSTELIDTGIRARSGIPTKLVKRIKELYGCIDEYTLRTEESSSLEIDHRIPQVRWSGNESINNVDMSDNEIKEKFMLLTRSNNLLKSRDCENCLKTGKRAKGYKTIEYWYVGDCSYNDAIGCNGCFWHNPTKWREELNKFIKGK